MEFATMKDLFATSEHEMTMEDFESGNLDILGSSAMQFVTVGIIIAVGALILAKIKENPSFSSDPTANDTLTNAQTGLADLSDFLPIIAIIIVAVVILAYLVVFRQ